MSTLRFLETLQRVCWPPRLLCAHALSIAFVYSLDVVEPTCRQEIGAKRYDT